MNTIDQPATREWRLRTSAEFVQFFRTDLTPCLQACEADRQKALRNVIVLFVILIAVAVIVALIILASSPNPGALVFVGLGVLIVGGIGYSMAISGYRSRFKHNLVSQVVRFFGPDFSYDPAACIGEGRFLQSRIFEHRIDRYSGEDDICGTAGKTRFECSEVHAEYKTTTTDSKGRTRTQWHTIFKGLFFIGDFNKHFNGITLVLPDTAQAAFGWFGQKLQEMNFSRPGDLVKLEDPEFEKLFVVYSTDQVEARYILSPSLMRRLTEYRMKVGRPVHVSFINESLFVAVDPGHDLFEPSVFSPVNYERCQMAFHDMCLALGIIEELNLNTRIWSKQ